MSKNKDKKDIFAPPSTEELAMFAPPSETEFQNVQDMTPEQIAAADELVRKQVNKAEIDPLLAGAAQGITFGFSDELGAAADVGGELITGKQGVEGLLEKWRQYQKAREAENRMLQEEAPGMYMAGELGAGLLGAAVMPSVGGARLAATAGRIAPGLGRFMAGQAGGALTQLAGKATTGAIEAAPIGALYGAGASEADISRPAELAGDIISGTTMGLVTGGGLAATGGAGKKAYKMAESYAEDTDFLRQLKAAYEYGLKGLNIGSSKVQDKLSLIPGRRAEDLTNKIFKVDDLLGKQVGAALEEAQQAGVRINVDPAIQQAGNRIYNTLFVESPTLGQVLDPKSSKILKQIAQQELGDLNPIEARALRDELFGLSNKLAGYQSDAANFARSVGNQLARDIDQNLKSVVPAYREAATHFEKFRRLVPETIISQATPSQYGKTYLGSLKQPELKLYQSSEQMLKKAKLPGEAAAEGRKTFEQLRRNLKELERTNPQVTQTMGGSADEVISRLKQQADELAMIRQSQGYDPQEAPRGVLSQALTGIVSTGRGLTLSAANKIGLVSKAANQSVPVRTAAGLYAAADDSLMSLAQNLKANSVTSQIGEALETAVANKNTVGKNAILFKLLQNPEYRNLLKPEEIKEVEGEDLE